MNRKRSGGNPVQSLVNRAACFPLLARVPAARGGCLLKTPNSTHTEAPRR